MCLCILQVRQAGQARRAVPDFLDLPESPVVKVALVCRLLFFLSQSSGYLKYYKLQKFDLIFKAFDCVKIVGTDLLS